jgi:hypothetical protein
MAILNKSGKKPKECKGLQFRKRGQCPEILAAKLLKEKKPR